MESSHDHPAGPAAPIMDVTPPPSVPTPKQPPAADPPAAEKSTPVEPAHAAKEKAGSAIHAQRAGSPALAITLAVMFFIVLAALAYYAYSRAN